MTAVATPQKACKILIISQESKKPDKLDEVIKNAFPDSTLFFATSLQDVYQIIKNPDAIIIDNTFPFEEKYEICCSLKKDYRFQDIAIAFLSSEDERDLQEKLLKAGADCFLFSPLLTASAHAQVQSMIKLTLANRKNRFTREQLTDLVADRDILLEELQKSQEKYHTIFNNAIVGICLFDTAGKVTFYNKLMSKHMGQPGSNLTGKTLIEILGEKGYPFHEHVLSVLRGDGRQDYEETTTISGMVCWFNSSYDPIINASGKIIGVQEITRDITKRRLAEKALQESEELYRKLVSASPDGIVVIDLQGKISIISDKCLKLMHISSQEELIGTGILQWVAEEDINKAKENLNQVVQTGSNTDQDFTVVLKDGTRILTEVNASLVNTLNESTPKVILVIRDITEWKETEKRMIQLSRAVRQVPASVVITDYKREIVYVNPQFCQSIGSTFTELQGKKIRSLSSVQALNTDYSKIIDTINSGHEWKGEIKRKNKNGATIVEFIHISPVFDEKNKITHFLEIIEDITELRQAEEKIKKYTDQLRALSSHNEKVREDERLNLAREIHDILGVSLSGIIMHLQVLKKSLSGISVKDPDINHQIDHIMKMASESVNSMRNLVRGIRPDSLEELGFVEAVLAFISELQSKTKLKFKISVIPEEIIIKTEKAIILFRVFQEVITNILNHSQATNVSILMKKEHRHLCLKIKDNGIGIKLNDLEKKTSFGIMGIKERMILLKGKVEFIGSASKGTTVNIDLPLY